MLGIPAITTFDPGTGVDVNLLTAMYAPFWKKSALPLLPSALTEPVADVKLVPLFINVGVAIAPLPILTCNSTSVMLFGSVTVTVGALV